MARVFKCYTYCYKLQMVCSISNKPLKNRHRTQLLTIYTAPASNVNVLSRNKNSKIHRPRDQLSYFKNILAIIIISSMASVTYASVSCVSILLVLVAAIMREYQRSPSCLLL